MTTAYHAKYWAESLALDPPEDELAGVVRSLGDARVDLQPHQIDAALFAMRSPYAKGVLLADEVGLGKTIEACLVLSQRWAERRRRILLVAPATLRKQWQNELREKFFLPSRILEAKGFKEAIKAGRLNPFDAPEAGIVITSYNFVYTKRDAVAAVDWDLVVVDEAHRLRNAYKGTKTLEGTAEAIRRAKKLFLTATPLQNSLLELYGLVSILDPEVFGSQEAFQSQFMSSSEDQLESLRERLRPIVHRTLRKDVLHYISYPERHPVTAKFHPSDDERQLYAWVSEYLQRDHIAALPNTQRKLITLILRKLLASSSSAIGATLDKLARRLRGEAPTTETAEPPDLVQEIVGDDYEVTLEADASEDEPPPEPPPAGPDDPGFVAAEAEELARYAKLAQRVSLDGKARALLEHLPRLLDEAEARGAQRKAVVFTESVKTQQYLSTLLSRHGFEGKIALLNGQNTDVGSKALFDAWKAALGARFPKVTSGSRTADMKMALVERFRDAAEILIATESAAEGVNLQFCALVVNYDLPWNPQRIEQRIGRCHRYGQKSDVVVVNFLNLDNAADERVLELLDQKLQLFRGVFGASDDVLGIVEDGLAIEPRIAEIIQRCRTPEQIKQAFDELQRELDEIIAKGRASARRAFLDHFDREVHDKLQVHDERSKEALDQRQRVLLDLARHELGAEATFDPDRPRFVLRPEGQPERRFDLDWKGAEADGLEFFRPQDELAQRLIERARHRETPLAGLAFTFQAHESALAPHRGASGWLQIVRLRTEALGRQSESLVLAALTDAAVAIPQDVAAKLLALPSAVQELTGALPPPALEKLRAELSTDQRERAETKDQGYFAEEEAKIERWRDDLKVGYDNRVRELRKQIDQAKRDARKTSILEEQLQKKREVRTLETRFTTEEDRYIEERRRMDRHANDLLEAAERFLRQRSTEETVLFTVRWSLS